MSPRTTDSSLDRTEARDRGLRRVRTATGWITVASTVGAVVLAGGYAQALPGKTASATPAVVPAHSGTVAKSSAAPSASSRSASTTPPATQAPASSSAPALQAPAQAPTTAASTAQTTSGGS